MSSSAGSWLSRVTLAACVMTLAIQTPSVVAARGKTIEIMEGYRWNKRPLLVFAPESDNSVVRDQRAALADAAQDFRDRDMVHVEVLGDAVWIDRAQSNSANADQLRTRYRITESETAVLLIGKDGGVKLRRDGVIDPRDLYGLIDTMPMRQREMRDGGASR